MFLLIRMCHKGPYLQTLEPRDGEFRGRVTNTGGAPVWTYLQHWPKSKAYPPAPVRALDADGVEKSYQVYFDADVRNWDDLIVGLKGRDETLLKNIIKKLNQSAGLNDWVIEVFERTERQIQGLIR